MKWGELKPGDVVSHKGSGETCLLLNKDGVIFTWFVLNGESYLAYGTNPYTNEVTLSEFEIDPIWTVFQS